MTYYARLDKQFFARSILLAAYIKFYSRYPHELFWPIMVTLFAALVLPGIVIQLYLVLFKKPIFTANETFIFDHYAQIKYYWDDIEQVIYRPDEFLEIKLNEPKKYLRKLPNPIWRLRAFFVCYVLRRKFRYTINLDLLDIKKGENNLFINTLNQLSF
jgi:hypothetical protein